MTDTPENTSEQLDSTKSSQPSSHPKSYDEIPTEGPVLDDDYALNPSFVRDVIDALERGDRDLLYQLIHPLHAADVADLLGLVSAYDRSQLIKQLGGVLEADVLTELDDDVRDAVLEEMHPRDIATVVENIDSDDAVQLIEDLPEQDRKNVLELVSKGDRTTVEIALTYEEDSAGRLMQHELVTVPPYWNVGQVIDHMRETEGLPNQFFEIYVVDEKFYPVGCVPVSRLLKTKRQVAIKDIMDDEQHLVPVNEDQGEVAYLFNQYHLLSAAVVNDDGRLVGMITVDDIVDVIKEEDTEDILALGGVKADGLSDGVLKTTQRRFSWLLINLATAILASVVIAFYDATIEKFVALAILMPIVASMGGNAGTQTLTVAVRAIATRDLTSANAFRIFMREVMVGGLNGFLFAVVMGVIGAFWFDNVTLGLVLGGAMIVNLLFAGAAGILVPLGLQRAGADPAIASTVFVTTVTDMIGFFVFLGLGAYALT